MLRIILEGCKQKIFILGLSFAFFSLTLSRNLEAQTPQKASKKVYTIGMAVLKDNPDYYAGRTAFETILEQEESLNVEFKLLDAYGDIDVYKKGLEKFVKVDKVDLIFTTGTRSTIPAVEIVKDIPIVFTAVASPVQSKIVKSLEVPGGNVTGTHCAVSAYAQIMTIKKIIPSVKTIGIIYTEGELNAEIQLRDFQDAAKKIGCNVLTMTVPNTCKTKKEVSDATQKLVGKVDVLVALQDTSLSRYGEGMIAVAEKNKIPTYVVLGQLLNQGAVFSLGIDFHKIGMISGKQAIAILKGNVNPGGIPVDTYNKYSLIINLSAAKRIGLTIPIQVLRTASKIMK